VDRKVVFVVEISACVCRGVLRVWGMRIQDSRTDFGGFSRKRVGGTSTRGWCKIKVMVEAYGWSITIRLKGGNCCDEYSCI
jgi:hypothetical protein